MRYVRFTFTAIMLMACMVTARPLLAGPLDRMDTGPRMNPATNNMLRVPGVVGMDYQSALATLEQAGLNPRVHMMHKQNGKYAGQEGMVVKQLPTAGGVAMVGSSVSISVYAPDSGQGQGNGMPDQGPPYGQGNGGDMGGPAPAPGQAPPDAGANGQGGTGNTGIVPPPVPVGGWQGPTGGAGPDQKSGAPAERPTQPDKQQTPVVTVPIKRPGTYPGKAGHKPGAGSPPSEPERKQAPDGNTKMHPITVKHPSIPEKQQTPPVVKVPVKRPGKRVHTSASSTEGSGPPTGPEREKPVAHVPAKKTGRVHHATPVRHPAIPEKHETPPVVKVPVKHPGHHAGTGHGSASGAPPTEPERRQAPVAKSSSKKSGKKHAATTGGDDGNTFHPIDWGRKTSGGTQTPPVPKKPEGHSGLLGSQRGGL